MSEITARVLVADDDVTVRLLMQATLEEHQFTVTMAEDGENALQELANDSFDMVLLDVDMPRRDGYQVCAEIRRLWGTDIPVVLVTGHDDVDSIERAYQTGATDFIAKPINWTLIGYRLRYVLRAFRTVQSLNAAEAKNRALLRALPDLLLRINAAGGVIERHGRPGVLNDLFHGAGTLAERLPEDAAEICLEAVRRTLATNHVENVEFKVTVAGGVCYVEGRIAAIGANDILCLLHDASNRREAEQKVRYLAYYDTLTCLPNRQSFRDLLERAIARAQRQKEQLAVLFMDLDGFKGINDSFGHHVGDQVLQWAAERLRTGLRLSDIKSCEGLEWPDPPGQGTLDIARLGGDEFTILLSHLQHPEDALSVARRVGDLMRQPFIIEGHELVTTTSIGISIFPDDAHDAASLLKFADTAMYAAKTQGRDNCQYYSAPLTERAVRRLSMESSLRLALDRNEFHLVYQPQIDVKTGLIRSVEALLRWQHPERGLIPPLEFIPLAEENGMILPIGAWVLHTACTDAMRWQGLDRPAIQVAVNLSPVQFRNPYLQRDVLEVLRDTHLPVEQLELEITESVLMDDAGHTLTALRNLRETGLRIALDDFGTGYSSLSYLKRLPLSNLKVDRSFVCDLPASPEDEAIIGAVVAMAGKLGMRVTAEGVETQAQSDILVKLGCHTLQGYLFSRPVPFEAMSAMLSRAAGDSRPPY